MSDVAIDRAIDRVGCIQVGTAEDFSRREGRIILEVGASRACSRGDPEPL